MCIDLADDVAVTRAVHDKFLLDDGHLVLSPGPGAGGAEDLMREILIRLDVLWRLPTRLQCGRNPIVGDDRAAVQWEISWALTRAGVADLWVLHADLATAFAWRWLRETVECEHLHLTLHTTVVPDFYQVAALNGARVRILDLERLCPQGRRPSWWESAATVD